VLTFEQLHAEARELVFRARQIEWELCLKDFLCTLLLTKKY
jgi:hypothetical protein